MVYLITWCIICEIMHWKAFHFHTIFSFVESHHNTEKGKMPKGSFFFFDTERPTGIVCPSKVKYLLYKCTRHTCKSLKPLSQADVAENIGALC